jgi:predicted nuclease with RNAse H fold
VINWKPKIGYTVAGIDLAALPRNPTGICIMGDDIFLLTLYKDEEILAAINEVKPKIVAIDAPLMKKIRIREADKILKKYGAMPPTMLSMRMLVKRASEIVEEIEAEVIEVFPTATAKILGIYEKDWHRMAEKIDIKAKNKHELDAYLAAYTAYLHIEGKTEEVGKKEKVIVPKVF